MNGVQIRVGDLLYAIGKRWKMILAFVLVGCGFGAALSGDADFGKCNGG